MTVHYRVSIAEASAHLVDVSLQIGQPSATGQRLRLPNWIPGSYMIRDFSRNIVQISATSNGSTVTLEKVDKSTWQAPSGLDQLTINYRIYAWDLSVRAAHVDQTHAFLNGTSIFLCVEGQDDGVQSVTFERPVHDVAAEFQLATTLPAIEIDASGFGHYQACNYDELIDHPVEQGDFKRLAFLACGVPHEVVLTGRCHFDEARLTADLTRICEYQIKLFGEPAPVDRYVFMVMVVDAGYGGLEHRASTALMITRDNLPIVGETAISDKYLDFLGLCSHEYFHTWNVKRIKPARFVPYALNAESYTELLWFFEGMTSYYDDLVLVRTGLIDSDRYLGLLAKTLTRVRRGAGRLTQSVTDSSFDAWHKFYKQDENAPNAIVSYYAKGALIALCLDALLRTQTNNKISLDSLMRVAWNRWLASAQGMAEQEPQQLAEELAGTDLSAFFEQVLYSTAELPVEKALQQLGVKLAWTGRQSSTDNGGVEAITSDTETDTVAAVEKPWLGATVVAAGTGVRLTQVMRVGPALKAGLSAGDVLIAINLLAVSVENLDTLLHRHADLPDVVVHYFRLGQLYQTQLALELPPADTARLSLETPTLLQAWLEDKRLAETDA